MQSDLFNDSKTTEILNLDPEKSCQLVIYRQFYDTTKAQTLFETLLEEIPWQQDDIKIAGRTIPIPRKQAWFGDKNAHYSYSGIQLTPIPFTPSLAAIKSDLETVSQADFNSLLANLYRDGNDSVGWHSDDEKELGTNPVIASLSLGTTRRFSLKPKTGKQNKPIHIDLNNGDLLIMGGATQHHWRHQVSKSKRVDTPRINLTFRKICVK